MTYFYMGKRRKEYKYLNMDSRFPAEVRTLDHQTSFSSLPKIDDIRTSDSSLGIPIELWKYYCIKVQKAFV